MTSNETSNVEQTWRRPWSLNEIVESSKDWSLASDAGVCELLKKLSTDLLKDINQVKTNVADYKIECKDTDVFIQNTFNDLCMLANDQFMENLVEDLSSAVAENNVAETNNSNNFQKEDKMKDIETKVANSLKLGIEVLDAQFELLEVNRLMSVSQETSDEPEINEYDELNDSQPSSAPNVYLSSNEPIYHPKDPYENRLLPHIIGTLAFANDESLGIGYLETDEIEEEDLSDDNVLDDENNMRRASSHNLDSLSTLSNPDTQSIDIYMEVNKKVDKPMEDNDSYLSDSCNIFAPSKTEDDVDDIFNTADYANSQTEHPVQSIKEVSISDQLHTQLLKKFNERNIDNSSIKSGSIPSSTNKNQYPIESDGDKQAKKSNTTIYQKASLKFGNNSQSDDDDFFADPVYSKPKTVKVNDPNKDSGKSQGDFVKNSLISQSIKSNNSQLNTGQSNSVTTSTNQFKADIDNKQKEVDEDSDNDLFDNLPSKSGINSKLTSATDNTKNKTTSKVFTSKVFSDDEDDDEDDFEGLFKKKNAPTVTLNKSKSLLPPNQIKPYNATNASRSQTVIKKPPTSFKMQFSSDSDDDNLFAPKPKNPQSVTTKPTNTTSATDNIDNKPSTSGSTILSTASVSLTGYGVQTASTDLTTTNTNNNTKSDEYDTYIKAVSSSESNSYTSSKINTDSLINSQAPFQKVSDEDEDEDNESLFATNSKVIASQKQQTIMTTAVSSSPSAASSNSTNKITSAFDTPHNTKITKAQNSEEELINSITKQQQPNVIVPNISTYATKNNVTIEQDFTEKINNAGVAGLHSNNSSDTVSQTEENKETVKSIKKPPAGAKSMFGSGSQQTNLFNELNLRMSRKNIDLSEETVTESKSKQHDDTADYLRHNFEASDSLTNQNKDSSVSYDDASKSFNRSSIFPIMKMNPNIVTRVDDDDKGLDFDAPIIDTKPRLSNLTKTRVRDISKRKPSAMRPSITGNSQKTETDKSSSIDNPTQTITPPLSLLETQQGGCKLASARSIGHLIFNKSQKQENDEYIPESSQMSRRSINYRSIYNIIKDTKLSINVNGPQCLPSCSIGCSTDNYYSNSANATSSCKIDNHHLRPIKFLNNNKKHIKKSKTKIFGSSNSSSKEFFGSVVSSRRTSRMSNTPKYVTQFTKFFNSQCQPNTNNTLLGATIVADVYLGNSAGESTQTYRHTTSPSHSMSHQRFNKTLVNTSSNTAYYTNLTGTTHNSTSTTGINEFNFNSLINQPSSPSSAFDYNSRGAVNLFSHSINYKSQKEIILDDNIVNKKSAAAVDEQYRRHYSHHMPQGGEPAKLRRNHHRNLTYQTQFNTVDTTRQQHHSPMWSKIQDPISIVKHHLNELHMKTHLARATTTTSSGSKPQAQNTKEKHVKSHKPKSRTLSRHKHNRSHSRRAAVQTVRPRLITRSAQYTPPVINESYLPMTNPTLQTNIQVSTRDTQTSNLSPEMMNYNNTQQQQQHHHVQSEKEPKPHSIKQMLQSILQMIISNISSASIESCLYISIISQHRIPNESSATLSKQSSTTSSKLLGDAIKFSQSTHRNGVTVTEPRMASCTELPSDIFDSRYSYNIEAKIVIDNSLTNTQSVIYPSSLPYSNMNLIGGNVPCGMLLRVQDPFIGQSQIKISPPFGVCVASSIINRASTSGAIPLNQKNIQQGDNTLNCCDSTTNVVTTPNNCVEYANFPGSMLSSSVIGLNQQKCHQYQHFHHSQLHCGCITSSIHDINCTTKFQSTSNNYISENNLDAKHCSNSTHVADTRLDSSVVKCGSQLICDQATISHLAHINTEPVYDSNTTLSDLLQPIDEMNLLYNNHNVQADMFMEANYLNIAGPPNILRGKTNPTPIMLLRPYINREKNQMSTQYSTASETQSIGVLTSHTNSDTLEQHNTITINDANNTTTSTTAHTIMDNNDIINPQPQDNLCHASTLLVMPYDYASHTTVNAPFAQIFHQHQLYLDCTASLNQQFSRRLSSSLSTSLVLWNKSATSTQSGYGTGCSISRKFQESTKYDSCQLSRKGTVYESMTSRFMTAESDHQMESNQIINIPNQVTNHESITFKSISSGINDVHNSDVKAEKCVVDDKGEYEEDDGNDYDQIDFDVPGSYVEVKNKPQTLSPDIDRNIAKSSVISDQGGNTTIEPVSSNLTASFDSSNDDVEQTSLFYMTPTASINVSTSSDIIQSKEKLPSSSSQQQYHKKYRHKYHPHKQREELLDMSSSSQITTTTPLQYHHNMASNVQSLSSVGALIGDDNNCISSSSTNQFSYSYHNLGCNHCAGEPTLSAYSNRSDLTSPQSKIMFWSSMDIFQMIEVLYEICADQLIINTVSSISQHNSSPQQQQHHLHPQYPSLSRPADNTSNIINENQFRDTTAFNESISSSSSSSVSISAPDFTSSYVSALPVLTELPQHNTKTTSPVQNYLQTHSHNTNTSFLSSTPSFQSKPIENNNINNYDRSDSSKISKACKSMIVDSKSELKIDNNNDEDDDDIFAVNPKSSNKIILPHSKLESSNNQLNNNNSASKSDAPDQSFSTNHQSTANTNVKNVENVSSSDKPENNNNDDDIFAIKLNSTNKIMLTNQSNNNKTDADDQSTSSQSINTNIKIAKNVNPSEISEDKYDDLDDIFANLPKPTENKTKIKKKTKKSSNTPSNKVDVDEVDDIFATPTNKYSKKKSDKKPMKTNMMKDPLGAI